MVIWRHISRDATAIEAREASAEAEGGEAEAAQAGTAS